jgi:hypothetical protein
MSAFKVRSLQERKNEKAINMMFQGLNDEYMRNALLCAYAGQDESILDEIVAQQKADYELMVSQMKIQNVEETVIPQEEVDKINSNLLTTFQKGGAK